MKRIAALLSVISGAAAIVTLVLLPATMAMAHSQGGMGMQHMPMMCGGMMGMGQGMGMGGGMGMGHGMMGMDHGGMMGMSQGMMGGGMMGMGPMAMLNLSDEQRDKLNKINDALHKQHWETMGKIMEEGTKLRDLYDADTPDAKKIGAVYERIFALQRQKIEAGIEAQNKMRAVLTKEQQEQLKQMRRGGMPMYGPGGMMRHQGPMGPGMRMQVP